MQAELATLQNKQQQQLQLTRQIEFFHSDFTGTIEYKAVLKLKKGFREVEEIDELNLLNMNLTQVTLFGPRPSRLFVPAKQK